MHKFSSKQSQQGIGILEVLIAVVVLSVALLSLGGLHTLIIKSSSQAKSRGVATALAQEKLDELRAYGLATDSTFPFRNICGADTMVANPTNYDGTNFGNTIPANVNGNVTFTRSWSVYGFNFAGNNTAPTYDSGATCPPDTATDLPPDLKLVAMTVTWQDENGERHNMLLQSSISNMNARAAMSTLNAPCSDCAPKFELNPDYVGGAGTKHTLGPEVKRVSDPLPDTNRGNNDTTSNTVTSFQEEVYNLQNQLIGQSVFVTVNCYCKQAAASTTDPGLEPSILDSDIRHFVVGEANTSKRRGILDETSSDGLQDQPPICKICCRDHHDDTDATEKYDPFKPAADYGSSSIRNDHNHYNWAFSPPVLNTNLSNATGERYAEACRMSWIGGQLRVLQDWRLENLIILPPDFFSSTTNSGRYTSFVTAFITEFVKAISTSYPSTMPRRDDILATSSVTTAKSAMLISSYETLTTSTETTNQLTARGLYIDYMSIDLINTLKCKINASSPGTLLPGGTTGGASPTCSIYGITTSGDYLHLIPFHDVNVTKLAKWTSSNGANITVTSDSLLNSNEDDFSRGKVSGITNNSRACITAKINTSNTGLTATDAIDPEDYSSTLSSPTLQVNPAEYKMPVTYGTSAAADPCTTPPSTRITGTITAGAGTGLTSGDVYITAENVSTGQKCTLTGQGGSYDSNTACTTQLQDATDIKLHIWHYTHRTTGGSGATYLNCVLNNSVVADPAAVVPSFTSGLDDDYSCTGGSCGSADYTNFTSEYTTFRFSGLTAGGTTTFNFTINTDASDSCTTSDP
jgi:hypothetical protein